MPLFNKKENKKVDESAIATRSGNAQGYQKSEQYRKGKTGTTAIDNYLKNYFMLELLALQTKYKSYLTGVLKMLFVFYFHD